MCNCEPEVDEPGEEATHFRRTCEHCGFEWWGLHCPHDLLQNPCGQCGIKPTPVTNDATPDRQELASIICNEINADIDPRDADRAAAAIAAYLAALSRT